MNHKIIKEIEAEQMRTDLPNYTPGDTVVIHVEFMEGTRKRIQPFEGIVLAVKNRGLNSSITVRKISQGEGVERVFSVHSPSVNKIEIKRRGKVNRAKIYYLRDLKGRAARIPEDLKQARKDRAAAQAEKSAGA